MSVNYDDWAKRCLSIERNAKSSRCDLMLRYFDIKSATGEDRARWQPFQIQVLNTVSMLSIMNKARQIGASFTASGKALGDLLLVPNHTIITISYNLEEAKEKIRYLNSWWESRHLLPHTVPAHGEFDENGVHQGISPYRISHWPEVTKSNALEIQFDNGSRFISHPCRPPRGKRATVVLDEFAHQQGDNLIFQAALPMITRGNGKNYIDIMSTPKGADGKFWEIFAKEEEHPDYVRFSFGWWEVDSLCPAERRLSCLNEFLQGIPQIELVEKYGTPMMKFLWNNTNPKEDFYQEYGLAFLDSVYAYLPWALIRGCYPKYWNENEQNMSEEEAEDRAQFSLDNIYQDQYIEYKVRCEGSSDIGIQPALDAIQSLRRDIVEGRIIGRFVWAYDCGRTNDCAEITVLQINGHRSSQRLQITMAQMPFELQRVVIRNLLELIPFEAGLMDKGGIGMDIHEWASTQWGPLIAGAADFSNENKDKWAKSLKRMMELRRLTIIPDKEQDAQLHSIQRVSNGRLFIYQVGDNVVDVRGKKIKHHADKFWSVAMATYLAEKAMNGEPVELLTAEPRTSVSNAYSGGSRGLLTSAPSRARDATTKAFG